MTQCTLASKRTTPGDTNYQVVYIVDREGAFIYDLDSKKTKKIYTTDQYFLKKKMGFLPDNFLMVGHQSASYTEERVRVTSKVQDLLREEKDTAANPNTPVMDTHLFVTDTFYAVHMDNGESYKYKTIDYEYIKQQDLLKSKTILFDRSGNIINENDTVQYEIRMYHSAGAVVFMPSMAGIMRGQSESNIVNGIQIFSSKGSLYLKNENDTVLFIPFDGPFNLKQLNGYYAPEISGDGRKVVVQYVEKFLSRGSVIMEIDLETKELKELIGYSYFNPKYSPAGQKIMIAKGHKRTKKDVWVNTLYIFDIRTGKKTKIGKGIEYIWRPDNSLTQAL
jgi:hypothetical protein